MSRRARVKPARPGGRKWTPLPGYPLASYTENGTTTDATHCPNCGSDDLSLRGNFSSGQRVGICRTCGANYIVAAAAAPSAAQPAAA